MVHKTWWRRTWNKSYTEWVMMIRVSLSPDSEKRNLALLWAQPIIRIYKSNFMTFRVRKLWSQTMENNESPIAESYLSRYMFCYVSSLLTYNVQKYLPSELNIYKYSPHFPNWSSIYLLRGLFLIYRFVREHKIKPYTNMEVCFYEKVSRYFPISKRYWSYIQHMLRVQA